MSRLTIDKIAVFCYTITGPIVGMEGIQMKVKMKVNMMEGITVAAFAAVVTLICAIMAIVQGWQTELLKSDFGGYAVFYAVFAGTTILTWTTWRILRHAFHPMIERWRLRIAKQNSAADALGLRRLHRNQAKLGHA